MKKKEWKWAVFMWSMWGAAVCVFLGIIALGIWVLVHVASGGCPT